MQSLPVFILLVVVGCSTSTAFITPEQEDSQNALVPIQRQQIDLYASSRRLIEQLIETIRKLTRNAYEAVGRFSTSVQEEAKSVRDRVVSNIQKLRERVNKAIESVRDRLIDSGVAVVDCIASHSSDANALFNNTLTKTMTCVDDRINEVGNQISSLKSLANNAVEFGNTAMEDMKLCAEGGGSLMETGSCMGKITVQTEMRALIYATQYALEIARIDLSLATLPASLEICAGYRLMDSGLNTTRLLMEIGTCSATSVFNTMFGNVEYQSEAQWIQE